tara:strand:- start:537 stop:710 length:174 start_codon:yes stop_codon:yes gene_type:complete
LVRQEAQVTASSFCALLAADQVVDQALIHMVVAAVVLEDIETVMQVRHPVEEAQLNR